MISRSQRQALNLCKRNVRPFSKAVATTDAADAAVPDYNVMSLIDFSNKKCAEKNAEITAEAAYQ